MTVGRRSRSMIDRASRHAKILTNIGNRMSSSKTPPLDIKSSTPYRRSSAELFQLYTAAQLTFVTVTLTLFLLPCGSYYPLFSFSPSFTPFRLDTPPRQLREAHQPVPMLATTPMIHCGVQTQTSLPSRNEDQWVVKCLDRRIFRWIYKIRTPWLRPPLTMVTCE